MAFQKVQGLRGKVYVPEQESPDSKKHDCRDCFSCQLCSDDRCHLCRNQKVQMALKIQDRPDGDRACRCQQDEKQI